MRLLVIGATGRLGSEVVRQALAADHHVTAFARNPDAVSERGERLAVVQGDVLDRASIEHALDGHDAVVSCLGTRDRRQRGLRETGMRELVAAMSARGVRRLVAFSAFGVGDSRAQLTRTTFFFSRVILPLLLARQFDDMEAMEAVVRRSGLEWVIVRPSALTTGPPTGDVKVFLDGGGKVGSSIPIADVAAFMLDGATSTTHLGTAPVISC